MLVGCASTPPGCVVGTPMDTNVVDPLMSTTWCMFPRANKVAHVHEPRPAVKIRLETDLRAIELVMYAEAIELRDGVPGGGRGRNTGNAQTFVKRQVTKADQEIGPVADNGVALDTEVDFRSP